MSRWVSLLVVLMCACGMPSAVVGDPIAISYAGFEVEQLSGGTWEYVYERGGSPEQPWNADSGASSDPWFSTTAWRTVYEGLVSVALGDYIWQQLDATYVAGTTYTFSAMAYQSNAGSDSIDLFLQKEGGAAKPTWPSKAFH